MTTHTTANGAHSSIEPIGIPTLDTTSADASANAEPPLPRTLARMDAERLRLYREHLEYYEGRRGAPPRTRDSHERVLNFNYARAVVEKGAAYLSTEHRPVVQPLGEGRDLARSAAEAQALLRTVWEDNELTRLDLESELDTAVLGDGAFKVTWDEQRQRPIVSAPDVQGLFAWWHGDDVRRLWRVALRYTVASEELLARFDRAPRPVAGVRPREVEVVEVWTATRFELWVQERRVDSRPNPYGVIPFVIYPNLPRPKRFWGVSDIEPLRESLGELNRALTQLSRILELSGNPIAVLENVEESRDIAVQPGAVWELPEQSRAYLLDLLQGGGVRLHSDYVELIYRTLHDLSETPRVAFGDGGGDRSGIALQLELDPLLRKVARKRMIRTTAMRARDRLILRIAGHHTGRTFEDVRTDIEWDAVFTRDPGMLIAPQPPAPVS